MIAIAKLALALAGLTGLLAIAPRLRASPGAAAKVGDEVVVPISALPGVPAPPNAGAAIVAVETAGNETLFGRIVAFQGSGGTADLRTPLGPVVVDRKSVSLVLTAPPDRVGRFADVGDDVTVDARDPAIVALLRPAGLDALDKAFPGTQIEKAGAVDFVLVRVEKMTPTGLSGVARGFMLKLANGFEGKSLSSKLPTPAGAPNVGEFSRASILSVSRDGQPIAGRSKKA